MLGRSRASPASYFDSLAAELYQHISDGADGQYLTPAHGRQAAARLSRRSRYSGALPRD